MAFRKLGVLANVHGITLDFDGHMLDKHVEAAGDCVSAAETRIDPRDYDVTAAFIRKRLFERVALIPGENRGKMHDALHGNLGTIIERAGSK